MPMEALWQGFRVSTVEQWFRVSKPHETAEGHARSIQHRNTSAHGHRQSDARGLLNSSRTQSRVSPSHNGTARNAWHHQGKSRQVVPRSSSCALFGSRLRGCSDIGRPILITGAAHDIDGWGFNLLELIKVLALATRFNMTFGGLYHGQGQGDPIHHGISIFEQVSSFMGVGRNTIFNAHEPNLTRASIRVYGKDEYWPSFCQPRAPPPPPPLRRSRHRRPASNCPSVTSKAVCYSLCADGTMPQTAILASRKAMEQRKGGELLVWASIKLSMTAMSPHFLDLLHDVTLPKLRLHASRAFRDCARDDRSLRVAIHVRREDVTANTTAGMWEADGVFLRQISRIKTLYPAASFYVFSSTSKSQRADAFTAFQRAGADLHLDRPIFQTIADASLADVYINTLGTFSIIPALLSKGCIIFESWFDQHITKLPHWIGRSWTPTELARCITTAQQQNERRCRSIQTHL